MPTLPASHHKQLLEQRRRLKQRQRQRDKYQPFLHTARWEELRDSFRKHNPLCSRCRDNGLIKQSETVHHDPPRDSQEFRRLKLTGYEWDYLVAVCKKCHGEIHQEEKDSQSEATKLNQELVRDRGH